MGLTESFQSCSLVFAFVKLFCLAVVLYRIVFFNGWIWDDESLRRTIDIQYEKYSVPASFCILFLMVFPVLMVIGILKKSLRLLRICKVYNLIEKSATILLLLVTMVLMNRVYRCHYAYCEETVFVEMEFLTITSLLTALYVLFRNWMIEGTIASVKCDLYSLNRDRYVMLYQTSP